MNSRIVRIVIGALIWVFALAFIGTKYFGKWSGSDGDVYRSLATFVTQPSKQKTLNFTSNSNIAIGDPIFFEDEEGELVQVGVLSQVDSRDSQEYDVVYCDWARATFFASAPEIETGDFVTYHQTPTSMDWVARFLFPPERRQEIAELVASLYREHSPEIIEELLPILQDVWSETSLIIRDDVLASLNRHKQRFEDIGHRFRTEIVEQDLLPLVGEVIWPIVLHQVRPLMEDVGEQIWKEASVWRFGWRAMYDASPLPRRNLTQAEFNRFVEKQAIPVLTRNLPRFIEAQQVVLERIVSNRRVQLVVMNSLKRIAEDAELHAVLLDVVREAIVENPKLHRSLASVLDRPDLKEVLSLTDKRLEPTVVGIGEAVFGSPYLGVTPEFARILRNKILLKDERWFILHKASASNVADSAVQANVDQATLVVLPGKSTMENPFYYPARER